MRSRIGALTAGALAVALVAAGCSETTDTPDGGANEQTTQTGTVSYEAADNKGPAKAVDGAAKGGNLTIYQVADFEHIDPARTYVNTATVTGSQIWRTLTGYQEDGSGHMKLVGDLAVDPGKDVNDDCKVWEYTLRDNLKYEDGSPVTAADIGYGVARSFAAELNEGPHFIQGWLYPDAETYNATYKGPYNGGAPLPQGVEVVSEKVIRFTFPEAQCEMPYAAAMPTTAPVPAAKDTKADYDNRPFSSGPYKIKTYQRDASLVLERNPNWDPATDPIRTAYPDTITVTFGLETAQFSERLVADAGADQTAFMMGTDVPPEVLPRTEAAGVKERVLSGSTQYVWYLGINNDRIKDVNVRRALNVAVNKVDAVLPLGGETAGEPATTLISPTTGGWKKYDVFGTPPTGDLNKVKEYLGSTPAPELVLGHSNTALRTAQAEAIRKSLETAGFKVTMRPIESTSYYDEIGRKGNPYDLYLHGWGSDWPSANTIIPPLYDGREIGPEGNNNLSYLNEPSVSTEIDRIRALDNEGEAQAAWMALDEKIMRDYAPTIPMYYDKTYVLHGSKVGNAFLSDAFGTTSLNGIFVKP